MADKEITTFVVDVGRHMAKTSNGRTSTDLESGLIYVTDVVANKVLKERKTDMVSIITANSSISDNTQAMANIEVVHPIKQPLRDDLSLIKSLTPTLIELPDSDGIVRALLLAISEIKSFVGTKKFKKNVVVVTNSSETPELDQEMADGISTACNADSVRLVVIGVDFEDEGLPPARQENVRLWRQLVVSIPGSYMISGDKAVELVSYPAPKAVRPVKLFEVEFRIGADLLDEELLKEDESVDAVQLFQNDESCVSFTVQGYPAVKAASVPSRKIYGINPSTNAREPIKASTDYEIHNYKDINTNHNEADNFNEDMLENQDYETEVIDPSSLVKGYRYGSSTVVLTDILEKQTTYKTLPGLDIRGVIESKILPRGYLTSEAIMVFGSKSSVTHQKNLAAVVDALSDSDSFAIARFVPKPNAEVQMVVLIPVYINKVTGLETTKRKVDDENLDDIRALILTRLPFTEDEKFAHFPDMTTLKTTSGRVITGDHRLLPSSDVQDAMDKLVEKFDLSTLGPETDFDGKKRIFNPFLSSGLLPLPESRGNHDLLVKLSPGIHRTNQFLKKLLLDSSESLPKLNQYFKRDTYPDPKLLESVQKEMDELQNLLKLGPIVDKSAKPKRKRSAMEEIIEEEENIEELSLDELLSRGAR